MGDDLLLNSLRHLSISVNLHGPGPVVVWANYRRAAEGE